jgi:rhodanese-related sulfurtransferase
LYTVYYVYKTATEVEHEMSEVLTEYKMIHLKVMDDTAERKQYDQAQSHSNYGITSAAELVQLQKKNRTLRIIDLREQTSWSHGYIPGAEKIRLGDLLHDTTLTWYNPNHAYLFICHTGTTSYILVSLLKKRGVHNVYFLAGGVYGVVPYDADFPYIGDYQQKISIPNRIKSPILDSARTLNIQQWVDMRYDTESNVPEQIQGHPAFAMRTRLFWETSTSAAIDETIRSLEKYSSLGIICDSRLSCYTAEIAITLYPAINWTGIYDIRQW